MGREPVVGCLSPQRGSESSHIATGCTAQRILDFLWTQFRHFYVWTSKNLPNSSNGISAICKLMLWDHVAQSPVYVRTKKWLLAFFPMVISIYWAFILPSAEEDVSVKLTILKHSGRRGIKLQIMLISLPHSCVFRSYIKSHMEIVIATEQNWSSSKFPS